MTTEGSAPSPAALRDFWSHEENYDDAWRDRAQLAAGFFDGTWACEIGCGPKRGLQRYLPRGTTYLPADMKQWEPEVALCDLNTLAIPEDVIVAADASFLLGVLEYLSDIPEVLARLSEMADTLIFSYYTVDLSAVRWTWWVNAFSGPEIGSLFGLAGYQIDKTLIYEPGHYVMRARHRSDISRERRLAARASIASSRHGAA